MTAAHIKNIRSGIAPEDEEARVIYEIAKLLGESSDKTTVNNIQQNIIPVSPQSDDTLRIAKGMIDALERRVFASFGTLSLRMNSLTMGSGSYTEIVGCQLRPNVKYVYTLVTPYVSDGVTARPAVDWLAFEGKATNYQAEKLNELLNYYYGITESVSTLEEMIPRKIAVPVTLSTTAMTHAAWMAIIGDIDDLVAVAAGSTDPYVLPDIDHLTMADKGPNDPNAGYTGTVFEWGSDGFADHVAANSFQTKLGNNVKWINDGSLRTLQWQNQNYIDAVNFTTNTAVTLLSAIPEVGDTLGAIAGTLEELIPDYDLHLDINELLSHKDDGSLWLHEDGIVGATGQVRVVVNDNRADKMVNVITKVVRDNDPVIATKTAGRGLGLGGALERTLFNGKTTFADPYAAIDPSFQKDYSDTYTQPYGLSFVNGNTIVEQTGTISVFMRVQRAIGELPWEHTFMFQGTTNTPWGPGYRWMHYEFLASVPNTIVKPEGATHAFNLITIGGVAIARYDIATARWWGRPVIDNNPL
jgi:hypothetical protein